MRVANQNVSQTAVRQLPRPCARGPGGGGQRAANAGSVACGVNGRVGRRSVRKVRPSGHTPQSTPRNAGQPACQQPQRRVTTGKRQARTNRINPAVRCMKEGSKGANQGINANQPVRRNACAGMNQAARRTSNPTVRWALNCSVTEPGGMRRAGQNGVSRNQESACQQTNNRNRGTLFITVTNRCGRNQAATTR